MIKTVFYVIFYCSAAIQLSLRFSLEDTWPFYSPHGIQSTNDLLALDAALPWIVMIQPKKIVFESKEIENVYVDENLKYTTKRHLPTFVSRVLTVWKSPMPKILISSILLCMLINWDALSFKLPLINAEVAPLNSLDKAFPASFLHWVIHTRASSTLIMVCSSNFSAAGKGGSLKGGSLSLIASGPRCPSCFLGIQKNL